MRRNASDMNDRPVATKLRRIALIRPDRIGDTIIASAVIPEVRRAFPEAELVWVVRHVVAPLFAGPDFPARLFPYDEFAGPDVLAASLTALAPDAVVLLDPHPLTDRAAMAAGIPVRIGFDSKVPGALTHRCLVAKKAGLRHEAACCLAAVAMLPGFEPASTSATPVACVRPAPSLFRLESGLSGYAVIHPGAHGKKARVPVGVWLEVAERFHAETGLRSVLVGGEPDTDFPKSPALAEDLRGRLDLPATARVMSGAARVFSRDSGPAHLAAALGVPTVCVFMENTPAMGPARWAPLGAQVATVVPPPPKWYDRWYFDGYRRRVVSGISADRILAASRLLG